jgi:protein-tyrosine-phosphatase
MIAFVCLHGSAKSLIAAEYMGRLARAGGVELAATTSGPEPDAEVPANVIEGLLKHGIDARHRIPARVSAAALAQASYIVSFGCDLSDLVVAEQAVERWDDCPAVSENFDIAWAFITRRVEQLFKRLNGGNSVLVEGSVRAAPREAIGISSGDAPKF